MKRILLVTCIMCVLVSNAQFEAGKWVLVSTVNADFSSEKESVSGSGFVQTDYNNFGFNVNGGHLIRDNFLISLSLGYGRQNRFDTTDVRTQAYSSLSEVYKSNSFNFGFGISKIIPAGKFWAFSSDFEFAVSTGAGKGEVNYRTRGSGGGSTRTVVVLSEGENLDFFIGARLGLWFKPLDKFGIKINYAKLGYDSQSENLLYSDATDVKLTKKGFITDFTPSSLELGVFWLL